MVGDGVLMSLTIIIIPLCLCILNHITFLKYTQFLLNIHIFTVWIQAGKSGGLILQSTYHSGVLHYHLPETVEERTVRRKSYGEGSDCGARGWQLLLANLPLTSISQSETSGATSTWPWRTTVSTFWSPGPDLWAGPTQPSSSNCQTPSPT